MPTGDTIAAISSSTNAPAARMIVRVSGPDAIKLLSNLFPSPGTPGEDQGEGLSRSTNLALRLRLSFSGIDFPAWIYLFRAPRSATGEDVVEFHIPGNPILARMLLDELIRMDARQAEPGEFTARAYFNGRIGLSEAEGVTATIAAQNERELAAARQLLAGELARRLQPVLDSLAETLGLVEVGIDFSEEDVTILSKEQVAQRISAIDQSLADLLSQCSRFERLSHEPRIVLVGRPNAGKSTLLNALAGHERAVVSPHAGTTRDAIWAEIRLRRGMVRVIDVAGLEEGSGFRVQGSASIPEMMQLQTTRAMEEADLVVLLRDCTDSRPPPEPSREPDLRIATKSDLGGTSQADELPVSAKSGANLDQLRERLDSIAFGQTEGGAAVLALNARHVRAIEEARSALDRVRECLAGAGAEVLAMELREALDQLGGVLGGVTPDDVLGRIFSKFCIGK